MKLDNGTKAMICAVVVFWCTALYVIGHFIIKFW